MDSVYQSLLAQIEANIGDNDKSRLKDNSQLYVQGMIDFACFMNFITESQHAELLEKLKSTYIRVLQHDL